MDRASFKVFLFFAIGLTLKTNLFAQGAFRLFSSEIYEQLKKEGGIQKTYYNEKEPLLSLTPDNELAEYALDYWNDKNGKPVFIVENVYLKSKAELCSDSPDKVTLDYASRIMQSISGMQGMEYYSVSRKKYAVLYDEAYCIDSLKEKNRIDDSILADPTGKESYCYLKDYSFGKTYYKLDYRQEVDSLFVGFSIAEPIYSGIIKAVDKDNLKISIVYIDCGDDVVVYMISKVKFPLVKFIEGTVYDSFIYRLEAVYKWFIGQY